MPSPNQSLLNSPLQPLTLQPTLLTRVFARSGSPRKRTEIRIRIHTTTLPVLAVEPRLLQLRIATSSAASALQASSAMLPPRTPTAARLPLHQPPLFSTTSSDPKARHHCAWPRSARLPPIVRALPLCTTLSCASMLHYPPADVAQRRPRKTTRRRSGTPLSRSAHR